ncbi:MAG: hypothetical protein WBP08_14345 [Saprospiraceae bacterium]
MKKSLLIVFLFFFGLLQGVDAQNIAGRNKSDQRRTERSEFRNEKNGKNCKKHHKHKNKKMRKGAAGRGQFTPGEGRMSRGDNRKVF